MKATQPPKRAPRITGRSSVYPYKAQRFIAAPEPLPHSSSRAVAHVPSATPTRKPLLARRALPSPAKGEEDKHVFPREELEAVLARVSDETLFDEIDALAARSRAMRLGAQERHEKPPSSHQREEDDTLLDALGEEEPKCEPNDSLEDAVSPPRDHLRPAEHEIANATIKKAELVTSLQRLAYGLPDARRSPSPTVLEVEVAAKGGASVSGETAAESSVGDGAVSLRDASPPRPRAGSPRSSTADLHAVQIPRAHYILAQVNFSAW